VGANVQPGQDVVVVAHVEHVPIVRAIAREAYRAGALHVSTHYSDQHLRRAAVELGSEDGLGWTPPAIVEWARSWGDL
jgi:aminopeptidase